MLKAHVVAHVQKLVLRTVAAAPRMMIRSAVRLASARGRTVNAVLGAILERTAACLARVSVKRAAPFVWRHVDSRRMVQQELAPPGRCAFRVCLTAAATRAQRRLSAGIPITSRNTCQAADIVVRARHELMSAYPAIARRGVLALVHTSLCRERHLALPHPPDANEGLCLIDKRPRVYRK